MTGLRERKKEQTRRHIAETARRLFIERGFEHVTIAEVAQAADVAVQTVFNYFPTKEDLVYWRLTSFEDDLLAAVRERVAGRVGARGVPDLPARPGGPARQARPRRRASELTVLHAHDHREPCPAGARRQIFAGYTDALAAAARGRRPACAADDVRPHVAAAAMIGIHRALIDYSRERIAAGDLGPRLTRDIRAQARQGVRVAGRRARRLRAHADLIGWRAMAVPRLRVPSQHPASGLSSDEVELYHRTYTTLLRSSGETLCACSSRATAR